MATILTHCKCKLIYAIFSLILNDKLINAYWDRFVIKCSDGHRCKLFSCIMMYLADYPEK